MKAAQGGQRNSVNQAKEARSVGKIQFLTVLGANVSTLLVFGSSFVWAYFAMRLLYEIMLGVMSSVIPAQTNVSLSFDFQLILLCFDSIFNDFCSHFLAVLVDDDSLAVAKRIQEKNTRAASAADDPQSPSVAP